MWYAALTEEEAMSELILHIEVPEYNCEDLKGTD